MAIHTPFQNNKYGWLNEIKLYGKFWIRTSPNHLEKEDGYSVEVLGGPQPSNTFYIPKPMDYYSYEAYWLEILSIIKWINKHI